MRWIEALEPGRARYEVFDLHTLGLAIRVTPSGLKSWVFFYGYHGRLRRSTLGRYPDRKLAEARTEALNQRGRILNGADPATPRTLARVRPARRGLRGRDGHLWGDC